jgi:hypothetical protein
MECRAARLREEVVTVNGREGVCVAMRAGSGTPPRSNWRVHDRRA